MPYPRPTDRLTWLPVIMTALFLASCTPEGSEDGGSRKTLRDMGTFLSQLGTEEITDRPELAARIGVADPEVRDAANRRLEDRSQAAFERSRLERLERIHRIDRAALPPETTSLRLHFDVVRAAHLRAERIAAFGFGRATLEDAQPYVIDHISGAYLETPFLLLHVQTVRTTSEAEAYLARLLQLADEIEDERRRLVADADAGISPPEPLLRAIEQSAATLGDPVLETHPLLATLNGWLSGPDFSPDEAASIAHNARSILESEVLPAYARLRATANALTIAAPEEPGVWALGNGRQYYLAALAFHATRDTEPTGLRSIAQVSATALKNALLADLDAAEIEDGVFRDRIARAVLPPEPEAPVLALPPTPESELPTSPLPELRNDIAVWRSKSERLVDGVAAAAGVSLVGLDPALTPYLPPLSYQRAALDRSAPGRVFVNVETALPGDPLYSAQLRAETWPGRHLMQAAIAEPSQPVIRLASAHTGFEAGWAAYALELTTELNRRSGTPRERIGLLQARLIIAAATIVDIDIHLNRTPREAAIDYLADTAGIDADTAARLTDRISARPGEAAAAFVGMEAFRDLRTRSETVLQDRFNLAEFHTVILSPGPRPLDMVEADVERWYDARLEQGR